MSEIDEATRQEGVLGRGLGVWDRLAPLSAGAVATGLLAVGVGRTLGWLLGSGVRRSIGWSAVGALVPLALWLMAGPGDKEEGTGGMESGDG